VGERELHERGGVALLSLSAHVGAMPVVESLARARCRLRRDRRRRHAMTRYPLANLGTEFRAAFGVHPPDLGLDQAPEAVEPELLHDVLHARPAAVLPLPVAMLHAHDGLAPHADVFCP